MNFAHRARGARGASGPRSMAAGPARGANQRETIKALMAACTTLMDEVTNQRATDWGIVNDAMVAGARALRLAEGKRG